MVAEPRPTTCEHACSRFVEFTVRPRYTLAEWPCSCARDRHSHRDHATLPVNVAQLVPERPYRAGALVIVEVRGIRSGTYRVAAKPDTTPPVLSDVHVDHVEPRFDPRIACPPSGPAVDRVRATVKFHDDSPVRFRARADLDGKRAVANVKSFLRPGQPSQTGEIFIEFPAGVLSVGRHATARIEAVDLADNASEPIDISFDVPGPPPGTPASSAGANASANALDGSSSSGATEARPEAKRGCW